jgi:hypothetical protein
VRRKAPGSGSSSRSRVQADAQSVDFALRCYVATTRPADRGAYYLDRLDEHADRLGSIDAASNAIGMVMTSESSNLSPSANEQHAGQSAVAGSLLEEALGQLGEEVAARDDAHESAVAAHGQDPYAVVEERLGNL